jgi:hypothetical protein
VTSYCYDLSGQRDTASAGAWVALWALVVFAAVFYPRGFPIWVLVAMAVPAVLFLLAHKLTLSPQPGDLQIRPRPQN